MNIFVNDNKIYFFNFYLNDKIIIIIIIIQSNQMKPDFFL